MPLEAPEYMPGIKNNIAIIILAAGASTRLGFPKQLVKINKKTLLEKMTDTALRAECGKVVVVLGAYFEKVKNNIETKPVHIIENKEWEKGMGASISCGMTFLLNNYPNIKAVVLMLCDQLHMHEKIIKKIIEKYNETGNDIVACKYGETVGVPAMFNEKLFLELKNLNGHMGAKIILEKYKKDIEIIDFPKGEIDLDVESDMQNLK